MTLRDLKDNGVTIQGAVNIKVFDDDEFDQIDGYFAIDYEYDCEIPSRFYEMEINYMYIAADALQIELKKEDND